MDEEVSRASIYRRRCVAFGRNLAEKEVGNANIQRNREKDKRRVDKTVIFMPRLYLFLDRKINDLERIIDNFYTSRLQYIRRAKVNK